MLALSSVLAGQEILWQRVGVKDKVLMGGSSVFVGDINADGVDELAQMLFTWVPARRCLCAEIWFLSGRDGRTLRTRREPPGLAWNINHFVGLGDMDGDGVGDYVMRVQDPVKNLDFVEVRSAKTDKLIWQVVQCRSLFFGQSLAGAIDLDGDKLPDLLVGASRDTPLGGGVFKGAVYGYSHKGKFLFKVQGPYPSLAPTRGSIAGIGDVDGDGKDDFAAGGFEPKGRGAVFVFSGRTGKLLVTGFGERFGDSLGLKVTGTGDVDGDGVPDFAGSSGGSVGLPAVARVFSGRTGKPIHSWRRRFGSDFGVSLLGGRDLDRDGVPDLLVASGEAAPENPRSSGTIFLYSGRDGGLLATIHSPGQPSWGGFGGFTALGPTQPGSPFPVFATSETYKIGGSLTTIGRVTMFRSLPQGVASFGVACRGTLARAPQIGIRDLGSAGVRLQLSHAPPAARVALLLGLSRTTWAGRKLPYRLDALGFQGCSLFTSIDLVAFTHSGSTGLSRGYASLDLPLPLFARGATTLHGQWLVFGSGPTAPGALSDALSWRH